MPIAGCLAAAGCLAILAALAYQVPSIEQLDARVLHEFAAPHGSFVSFVASLFERLADWLPQVALVMLAGLIALRSAHLRRAILVVALVAGAAIITMVLKVVLAHPRFQPILGQDQISPTGFPSGHSAGALSMALAFVFAVPSSWRRLTAAIGIGFTLAVSISLVLLNLHYPSDVLGGWLVALGWCCALLAFLGTSFAESTCPAHPSRSSRASPAPGRTRPAKGQPATIRPVSVRRMLPEELEAAVDVWRAANIARDAPHGADRTARIRAKLSAPDALAFVALRSEIVGVSLAEPGRLDDGEGELDPTLLHISMVFVHPAAQGTGVGSSLVLHVLDAARSLGYQRASVWTYRENANARRLYEGVGMEPTGKTARGLTRTQIQYGCVLGGLSQVPQAAEGGPRGDLREASGE